MRWKVSWTFLIGVNLIQYKTWMVGCWIWFISNVRCDISRDNPPFVPKDIHHPTLKLTANMSFRKKHLIPPNSANILNFKKANFPELYSIILIKSYQFLDNILDVNKAVNQFYSSLLDIVTCLPKRRNIKQVYPMWYTAEIIANIKTKAKLHKKHKNTTNPFFIIGLKDYD